MTTQTDLALRLAGKLEGLRKPCPCFTWLASEQESPATCCDRCADGEAHSEYCATCPANGLGALGWIPDVTLEGLVVAMLPHRFYCEPVEGGGWYADFCMGGSAPWAMGAKAEGPLAAAMAAAWAALEGKVE